MRECESAKQMSDLPRHPSALALGQHEARKTDVRGGKKKCEERSRYIN